MTICKSSWVLCHGNHDNYPDAHYRSLSKARFSNYRLRSYHPVILRVNSSPCPIFQNNLVRCTSGAALVSVINLIIDAVGAGWAFVILGIVCLLSGPMILLETHRGPYWRERRWKKLEQATASETEHVL